MIAPQPKTTALAVVPPSTPLAQALSRLEATRANLRHELLPQPDVPALHDGQTGAPWSRRLRAGWRHWRRRLQRWPLASALLTGVQDAWRRHPWRSAAELVAQEARAAVLPAVRRHPVAAVAIAAVLGLAVVASRAWHWPVVSRPLRNSPRRVGGWLLHQLTQAPVQAALLSLLAMLAQRGHTPATGTPQASTTPAPPAAPGAQAARGLE